MAIYIDLEKEYGNWINNFYDMLFDEEFSKEDYQRCDEIKLKNMPNFLYQYTKVKHAKDLLKDNIMFLRPFNKLNDPFDGNFIHNLELYIENGMMIGVDKNYKEKYQVVCFSEKNDIVPMWTFYADDHKGICVEYNFLQSQIFSSFCFPVKYVDKTDNNLIIKKILNDENFSRRLDFELFLKKSQSWSHEKEWRMIFNDFSNFKRFHIFEKDDKKYIHFLKPTSVYLGIDIKPKHRESIKNLCRLKKINVYQMMKDITGYNLIPMQIL